jgi:hypothetical protein
MPTAQNRRCGYQVPLMSRRGYKTGKAADLKGAGLRQPATIEMVGVTKGGKAGDYEVQSGTFCHMGGWGAG